MFFLKRRKIKLSFHMAGIQYIFLTLINCQKTPFIATILRVNPPQSTDYNELLHSTVVFKWYFTAN